jgi:hypothetical protein
VAFSRGLFGDAGRGFVRTPKRGAAAQADYRSGGRPLAPLEVAIGGGYVWLAASAIKSGRPGAALALAGLVGLSYLWVGLGSLRR